MLLGERVSSCRTLLGEAGKPPCRSRPGSGFSPPPTWVTWERVSGTVCKRERLVGVHSAQFWRPNPVTRCAQQCLAAFCRLQSVAVRPGSGPQHPPRRSSPSTQPASSQQHRTAPPQIAGRSRARVLRSCSRSREYSRAAALVVTASVQPAAPGKLAAVSPASRELQCRSAGQTAGTGAATHGFPSLRHSGNPGAPPPALCDWLCTTWPPMHRPRPRRGAREFSEYCACSLFVMGSPGWRLDKLAFSDRLGRTLDAQA